MQQEGQYVLAVKENQEQLYADVVDIFRYVEQDGWQGVAHAHTRTVEGGHGRIETRDYWLIQEPSYLTYLNPKGKWPGLGALGMVVSERVVHGATSVARRYYVLSGQPTAAQFARAVRGHWGIENQVHWVLDVTFDEDQICSRSCVDKMRLP